MRYQHYEGTWTIGRPTPGWADEVIITPRAPIGDLDIETEVDMVADGTDRYLCIFQDPDSICTLGPLRAAG